MSIPIQECPECGFVTPCKCEKRKNPTYGQLLAEGKLDEPTTPAPTPWEVKEGYWYEQYQLMRERYNRQIGENTQKAERIKDLNWYEQYQLMRERYNRQIGENSKQAERIVQLEAALDAMVEGVARKALADIQKEVK